MSKGPSPHLAWSELACHDGTPYPAAFRESRAPVLAAEFEKIRAVIGKPITIGSAYRTPTHNRAVGGARNSQHVEGRALDLYPPAGWTVEQLYSVVHAIAVDESSALHGLGRYPTFVHVDIRPGPRLVCWQGSRAWAEVKKNTASDR